MMWLGVMLACTLGAIALSDSEGSSSKGGTNRGGASYEGSTGLKTSSNNVYTKEYVRANLDSWYYTNWQCEEIAYQLQDNWKRDDMDKMLRRGYRFYEAIQKMVDDGELHI